ncbi:MAG TPA: radical SAM protein [bacterium]|nr:radical SAM protein [bacterium]
MQRLTPPPAHAGIAVVMLTPACELHCSFCGAEESFGVLSRLQARALVEGLSTQGFESVVFGGGEPTLWPHGLREICAAARARGLLTQIGTSAYRLPGDVSEWREVDRWVLPLESGRAEAHDALRTCEGGHHAKVLRALHGFAMQGASVTVSTVARRGAEDDLLSAGALLESLRAAGLRLHAWHVYRFQAMGRLGRLNGGRFALSDEEWAQTSQRLKQRFEKLPLLLRPDMMHSHEVAFFWATPKGLWRQGPGQWHGLVETETLGALSY